MTEPEQPAKYTPPQIAYGIDIGMYRTGKSENVLSTTTFAWGRVEADAKLVSQKEDGKDVFSIKPDISENSGNDIFELVDFIHTDLEAGKRIAIGMEAPMWQPVPRFKPGFEYNLFPIRLNAEKGYEWYRQSGASALARAISTGLALFTILNQKSSLKNVSFSTTGKENVDIELFEGFVAGNWKLLHKTCEKQNHKKYLHQWDALLTALGFHYAKDESKGLSDIVAMHQPGTFDDTTLSHWHTILRDMETKSEDCNTDCLIVGFDKQNETICEMRS